MSNEIPNKPTWTGLDLMSQRDNLVFLVLSAESPEARGNALELLTAWNDERTDEEWLDLARAEYGKALRNGKAAVRELMHRYGGAPVPVGRN